MDVCEHGQFDFNGKNWNQLDKGSMTYIGVREHKENSCRNKQQSKAGTHSSFILINNEFHSFRYESVSYIYIYI